MGAFCTLVTYILMLFNAVTLLTAFFDGSRQDERYSTTTFDLYSTDQYIFADYDVELTFFLSEEIDPRYGGLIVY